MSEKAKTGFYGSLLKHKGIIVLVIVILVAIAGYFIFRSKPAKTRYVTQAVSQGTLVDGVSGAGNLLYGSTVIVSSQQSGVVQTVNIHTGQSVTQGQALYTISNPSLTTTASKSYASYLQAKQSVASAQATITQNQNNITTLETNPNTTASQLNLANQQLGVAEMAYTTAQYNVTAAWSDYQNQLTNASQTTIVAPIAGVISAMNVTVGNQVSGSGGVATTSAATGTVTIVDPNSLEATVSLNEVDAVKVITGQKADITFTAISGLDITGKVASVDTTATNSSGVVSYNAIISLDTTDARLKGGMSANAIITTQVKQNVLYVPNSAVKSLSGGTTYVQTLKNGVPSNITVQTGFITSSQTEITSGVSAGQSVITQTITPQVAKAAASSTNSLFQLSGGGGGRSGGFGGGSIRSTSGGGQ